jgi:diguanylate cyclase (GGDEF)-like protein
MTKKSSKRRAIPLIRERDHMLSLGMEELRKMVRQLQNEKANAKRELYIARNKIEALEEQVLLDGLTKVKNRKGFELSIAREISQLPVADDLRQATSRSLGLLIVDADFFKQINDQYGHDVGDEVLVSVANSIRNCVRSYDEVCRWGGEEFAVILPGISEAGLQEVGEKIRAAVADMVFDQHESLRVSVSIGGAVQCHQTDQGLFNRADAAMYAAKENGRNKVVIADLA